MKKYLFVNLLIFVFCLFGLNAEVIILSEKEAIDIGDDPTYNIPTTPIINAQLLQRQLNVSFENPVGIVQIAVENETGIKILDIANSNVVANWTASIQNLENGTYTLVIETEKELLEGEFEVGD